MKKKTQPANKNSSWESVSSWYDKLVGSKGHYYHEKVILPKLHNLFSVYRPSALLDLACGQGILSRILPDEVTYTGVDASHSLLQAAKKHSRNKKHTFYQQDLTQPLDLQKKDFDVATILLALQNIPDPLAVMKSAWAHLKPNSRFVLVLNHPCFRIPRQTSWMVDEEKKIQYRRVDRYLTPLTIPIQAHPSQGEKSVQTFSYHYSLSAISSMLQKAGFVIELMEEWCCDRQSTGPKGKMENRSRNEIPMFLAIVAMKI